MSTRLTQLSFDLGKSKRSNLPRAASSATTRAKVSSRRTPPFGIEHLVHLMPLLRQALGTEATHASFQLETATGRRCGLVDNRLHADRRGTVARGKRRLTDRRVVHPAAPACHPPPPALGLRMYPRTRASNFEVSGCRSSRSHNAPLPANRERRYHGLMPCRRRRWRMPTQAERMG